MIAEVSITLLGAICLSMVICGMLGIIMNYTGLRAGQAIRSLFPSLWCEIHDIKKRWYVGIQDEEDYKYCPICHFQKYQHHENIYTQRRINAVIKKTLDVVKQPQDNMDTLLPKRRKITITN